MKERVYTEKLPSSGVLSQGYRWNGLIFCSGQTGQNPETKEMPKTFAEQAEQCCKNLLTVLDAAGAGAEDVIKATCFLADSSNLAVFNQIYGKYFTGKPARSCVVVKELPNPKALCEIEAIAETR